MNFLYPGFLFALFSIAIPVIIHLFNFRKFKKVYFSNVTFLNAIKEQHSSREKLRNLLVLLSRVLAIAFLVLAFARPFISSNKQHDPFRANTVSIYIDNSYSMDAVNREGSLLDEAKRKAKEVARTFAANDRFHLLTNDFEGSQQRLLHVEEFMQEVDKIKISAASRSLQQVVHRQQTVFTGSNNRYSYIISDFQRGFAGSQPVNTDPQQRIFLVKLRSNQLPNVAVDSVWLLSPVHQLDATERLVVQLKNYGEEAAKNVPIKLAVNQQQKAISSLSLEAGQTRRDTLSFSGLSRGWQRAEVTIKDFPLTFDDALRFSFNVGATQAVLSINGTGDATYLQALFKADPYFQYTEMSERNINYAGLRAYSLVVLNGLSQPSSGLSSALKTYLQQGGTVVVFPDVTADKQVYSQFLAALGLPQISAVETKPLRVSAIELKHPLFKDVFESLPRQLDLPQVNRRFVYTETSTANKETLLHLPGNASFFARYPMQNGQVYLAATGLSKADSDLPEHPVFVPLLYKAAFSSVRATQPYYTLSKNNVLESQVSGTLAPQALKLVGDNFEVIPELQQRGGNALLYVADQVKKSGFYELRHADTLLSVIAFNDTRTESDMHYDDPDALKKIINSDQVSLIDPAKEQLSTTITKNNDTELWKLCLILSVLFLAVEIVLVRFYPITNLRTHEPLT